MNLVDLLADKDDERQKTRRVNGVVAGIVVENQDPERLGRIRVKFPWLSDDVTSHWAKVASFMAGKRYGAVFLPDVGDEVLIAFEQGDINFPYVIGALWNGEQLPPERDDDDRNSTKMIRSRSGHEILFHDGAAGQQKKLQIRTSGGHLVLLDDSAGHERIQINDRSGQNLIEIDSVAHSISVKCGAKLVIRAQTIEIEAGDTMTIKAGGVLQLQGALVKIN